MRMQMPGLARLGRGQLERLPGVHRRALVAATALVGGALLTGCAGGAVATAHDGYCYRARRRSGSRATCIQGLVPDAAADALAKQFEPAPGRLTLYLVRHRWADTVNVVVVGIGGGQMLPTVPASFVRFVTAPGPACLTFQWAKGSGELVVQGEAGQVVFVDLVGSLWFWNENYRLEPGDLHSKERVLKSRLVADVEVGAPQ